MMSTAAIETQGAGRRGGTAGGGGVVAATVASAILLLLVVAVVILPLIIGDGTTINPAARLQPPSFEHLLGTDELGRDLLARSLVAGRLTLIIACGGTLISTILGGVWGLLAAAGVGWTDELLMRLADAVLSIPTILLGLVAVAAFGSSVATLIVVLGLINTPLTARIIRAATLGELKSEYVRGVTVVGASRSRILFGEILPNIQPMIIAQATLNVALTVMVEASLSFVGVGIQPPDATWGTLLRQGYSVLFQAPSYAIFSAAYILVFIACLNTVGRYIQFHFDRRLT